MYVEKIFAEGEVLVVFQDEMWDLYWVERWYMLSFVFRHLAFQNGCVGAVDYDGSFGIVCGDGVVVDEVVGEDVFKVLLGGASKFYIQVSCSIRSFDFASVEHAGRGHKKVLGGCVG